MLCVTSKGYIRASSFEYQMMIVMLVDAPQGGSWSHPANIKSRVVARSHKKMIVAGAGVPLGHLLQKKH